MAKRVIDIQSPEEAEVLKATRKKIKELRLNKKKDADKLSAGEFPELQKKSRGNPRLRGEVGDFLEARATDGPVVRLLLDVEQHGHQSDPSWVDPGRSTSQTPSRGFQRRSPQECWLKLLVGVPKGA